MSLELNDVLIRIRHGVDHSAQGFSCCLREYNENPSKMVVFIAQCQYLIEKGWDGDFQEKYFPDNVEIDNDEVGFFTTVLNPLLDSPAQKAFKYKNISGNAEKLVILFTKLALLRLLFCAHKNNPCIDNPYNWFMKMKSQLEEEFIALSKFSAELKISYKGKIITNIEGLNTVIDELNQEYINNIFGKRNEKYLSVKIKGLVILAGVVLAVDQFLKEDSSKRNVEFSSLSKIIVAGIVLAAAYLCIKRFVDVFGHHIRYFLFQSAKEKNKDKLEGSLFSDHRIEKFFFITDAEIDELNLKKHCNIGAI